MNISVNYFYVQGIPVLHSISRNFRFRTVEFLMNKYKPSEVETKEGIGRIMNLYKARGLEVAQLNTDNEFEAIEDYIRPARLYIVAANEHVGDVERSVRTVKDCTRCHVHRLPYEYYPKIMVTGMISHVIKSLNQLPSETGIRTHLSPAASITGSPAPDFNSIINLNFGDYVQAYKPNSTTNDQEPRTIGAIALYPKNEKSWYFMSLETGKRVHRHGWTVLPISKEVLARVNHLGKRQKQSRVANNFKYSWTSDAQLGTSRSGVTERMQITDDAVEPNRTDGSFLRGNRITMERMRFRSKVEKTELSIINKIGEILWLYTDLLNRKIT